MLSALTAALLLSTIPQDAELARKPPSASDMYVSCYLFVRNDGKNNNSIYPETCEAMSIVAVDANTVKKNGDQFRFCLPLSSELRASTAMAMANAYISYFERNAGALTPRQMELGVAAYVVAMSEKWPCDGAGDE